MTQKRIAVLETLSWQLPVISISDAPPTEPSAGDRYLVSANGSGDFTDQDHNIAWRDSSQWHFDTPEKGWRVFVQDENKDYWFDGDIWNAGLIEGDFIKSLTTSTNDKVPQWDGTDGNKLKDGLTVRTTIREDGSTDDDSLGTEKAIRDALKALLGAKDAMIYKGTIDASDNPDYPPADAGHTYKISVAGKIGGNDGEDVEQGDMIICLEDGTSAGDQSTVGGDWNIIQVNIEGYVLGPDSSVVDNIATFDGTAGQSIKDSGLGISTVNSHIDDNTIHFTEASIDHTNIQNIGTNTHAQIDTHIDDNEKHRVMNYSNALKAIIYSE